MTEQGASRSRSRQRAEMSAGEQSSSTLCSPLWGKRRPSTRTSKTRCMRLSTPSPSWGNQRETASIYLGVGKLICWADGLLAKETYSKILESQPTGSRCPRNDIICGQPTRPDKNGDVKQSDKNSKERGADWKETHG